MENTQIAGLEVGLLGSIDDVDNEWMTNVLRTSGAIDADHHVCAVRTEPFAVGLGLLSLLYRIHLTYDGPAATEPASAGTRPATVILKLATDIESQRGIADVLSFYQRELRFYRELADDLPVETPRVHAAMMSNESTDFCLVMEDLSDLNALDQEGGATLDEAIISADAMGRFHAHFWGQDFGELAETFLPFDNPIYRAALPDVFASGWGPCKEQSGDLIPDEVRAFGDRFGELVPFFVEHVGQLTTIIHGDWRADNLLLNHDGELVLIDFQITGIGAAGYDLGYFLSQSVEPDVRRQGHDAIIEAYFSALAEAGAPFDREAELRTIRLATAFCLIYAVASYAGWDDLPEKSKTLLPKMLNRSISAIVDIDALSLIPAG